MAPGCITRTAMAAARVMQAAARGLAARILMFGAITAATHVAAAWRRLGPHTAREWDRSLPEYRAPLWRWPVASAGNRSAGDGGSDGSCG